MRILGIDEAGRGPLIGPLVMAGVMIETDEDDETLLEGVKDSKLLAHNKRLHFDKIIRDNFDHKIISVNPDFIDDAINSKELNLNWLEAHKQAEIINELQPEKAIIDCPSTNPEAFEKYLRKLLINDDIELIVEHKADYNYPIVAAASILAKVHRENTLDKLKIKYGDFGSGYPADPKTIKYIKENWNKHSEIFRKTWSTYKKYTEAKNQNTLF